MGIRVWIPRKTFFTYPLQKINTQNIFCNGRDEFKKDSPRFFQVFQDLTITYKVELRENSNVLIRTNNGKPFLIYKKLKGEGKIFCITGAPFEYNRISVFFNSPEWQKILERVIWEIKGGKI